MAFGVKLSNNPILDVHFLSGTCLFNTGENVHFYLRGKLIRFSRSTTPLWSVRRDPCTEITY